MALCNLVGQADLQDRLEQFIQSKKVSHAYLLTGPKGCGKKTLVKGFARELLCMSPKKPCGVCDSCIQAEKRQHPDLIWPTALLQAKEKVKTLRELLLAEVYVKPFYGGRKVFVLEDISKYNAHMQNALLKVLEEPPPYVVFILTSDTLNGILPTVLSRVSLLRVPRITNEQVEQVLKTHGVPSSKLRVLSSAADGCVGRALALFEDANFLLQRETAANAYFEVLYATKATAPAIILRFKKKKSTGKKEDEQGAEEDGQTPQKSGAAVSRDATQTVLDVWLSLTRDILLIAHGGDASLLQNSDRLQEIHQAVADFSKHDVGRWSDSITLAQSRLRSNTNALMVIEDVVLSWMEVKMHGSCYRCAV